MIPRMAFLPTPAQSRPATTPRVIVRRMTLDDINQVVDIDHESFSTPWSANAYRFEVTNRDTSHLVVLEMSNDADGAGLRRMLWPFGRRTLPGEVIGYGGCWLITGEAHISTIAIHPAHRGQGLGELLLASMLKHAIRLGGEYSVLEVRESNATAQALYRKYEYTVIGRRKQYYRDNGEDALLMEARPLDSAYYRRIETRLAALSGRVRFDDRFTR